MIQKRMHIPRRQLLIGTGAALIAPLLESRQASASSARQLTLSNLALGADRVLIARPVLCSSRWAIVSGTRRIVTCSRIVCLDEWSECEEPEDLVWTLGGRVKGLQQKVHGAAQVREGEAAVFFLRESQGLGRGVFGMAQGLWALDQQTPSRIARGSNHAGPNLSGRVLKQLKQDVQKLRKLRGEAQ